MRPLAFVGKLSASKSMLNRLLLVKSYFPQLHVQGESECDDVLFMQQAIEALGSGRDIEVGSAGTVLRFMALRASRKAGRHRLVGETRLFSRPQDELLKMFGQLGVNAKLSSDSLEIESSGWKMHGDTLAVSGQRSSQFLSSLLLNSWDLPFDLYVSVGGGRVSEGYWRMTVQMMQNIGMKIDFWDGDFRVSRGQVPTLQKAIAEIDLSSAFALAGVAAVNGQATFLDFPEASLQPDGVFVSILERMGVPTQHSAGTLKVSQAIRLNGVIVNLKSAPDLFPVLAVLCALAEGSSELVGATQLIHKESNRLLGMAKWVHQLGREVEIREDGLRIFGPCLSRDQLVQRGSLKWSCDQDHRLGFAAAVAMSAGARIQLEQKEVVAKSFPGFWEIIGDPP